MYSWLARSVASSRPAPATSPPTTGKFQADVAADPRGGLVAGCSEQPPVSRVRRRVLGTLLDTGGHRRVSYVLEYVPARTKSGETRGSRLALLLRMNLLLINRVLHIAATCTSLGGLFYARMVLLPSLQVLAEPERAVFLAQVIRRFAYIKWTGVTVVAVTGVIQRMQVYPHVSHPQPTSFTS